MCACVCACMCVRACVSVFELEAMRAFLSVEGRGESPCTLRGCRYRSMDD